MVVIMQAIIHFLLNVTILQMQRTYDGDGDEMKWADG